MTWEATVDGANPADGAVDVCAMFEAEVDRLPTPDAIPVVSTGVDPSNVTGPGTLVGFKLHLRGCRRLPTPLHLDVVRAGRHGRRRGNAAAEPVFRHTGGRN